MTPGELLWILALCGYAIYQQTRQHEVIGDSRFKLAIIYGIIGLVVGGFNLPQTVLGVAFLLVIAKFGLGTIAYFADVSDDGGIGEILIMIAVMVAVQAELIWRRAEPLGALHSSPPVPTSV